MDVVRIILDVFWIVIKFFKFWKVLEPYEYGIIITLGKVWRKKYLKGPGGIYFHMPFKIEELHEASTEINVGELEAQSLITTDGIHVTSKIGLVWQLEDVEAFLLRIADDERSVYTQCKIALAEAVRKNDFKTLVTEEWFKKLKTKCKERAKNYGVRVLEFDLIELTKTDYAIRMYNEVGPAIIGIGGNL